MVQKRPGPVSPYLNEYLLCRDMSCLPDGGGLNQQKMKTVQAFYFIQRTMYEAQSSISQGGDDQWLGGI
jgi:hypothetical protein